jgi:hypothetical protein
MQDLTFLCILPWMPIIDAVISTRLCFSNSEGQTTAFTIPVSSSRDKNMTPFVLSGRCLARKIPAGV